LKRTSTLYGILLGVMLLLPILFAKQLSSYVNGWLWPAIPVLPETNITGGLEFDGKDDYVQAGPFDWPYPQFTIEAFVTSEESSDNGTIAYLTSWGDAAKLEWMSLYDGNPAAPGTRVSGAAIQGKTPYAQAFGPFVGGIRQHRVLVFDGYHLHYYINGIWQGKRHASAHTGMVWQMKMLRFGCDGGERRFFQGKIDQVRISKVARYNNNFAPVTSVANDEATLALYNFDDGAGDVLKDASGNGHDGKVFGAKWANSKSEDLASRSDSPSEISNLKSQISNSSTGWPADAPAPAIAPFNTEQAQQHQTAWAKYLDIPAEFTDKRGTRYVLIPPGEFQMGFSQAELDTLTRELKQAGASEYDLFSASTSAPQHMVRITKPFYMSAHEVTVAEYRRFIDETHYMTTAEQLGGQRKKWSEYVAHENPDRHPVVGVSWTDAETYCVKRSEQDGVTYRLPSEAEWEYACRAGTTTLWSFGDNPAQIGENAVTTPEGTFTQPVGSRKPNPLGLFDMYGNADEWCLDWHTQDFYANCPTNDPVNLKTPTDANSGRVARGCGSISLPWQLRSSTRRWDFPSTPVNLKGFRLVLAGDLKNAATTIAATGWHGWPADAPAPAIAPFNAEQAKQHQEAWAKYLNVPVEHTNSIGMKLRLIPPGEFSMGSTPEVIEEALKGVSSDDKQLQENIRSEGPCHKVILTQPIYLGVNEVTQAEYEKVVGVNPSHFSSTGTGKDAVAGRATANHPVEQVNWNDAAEFCVKFSQQEKLEPFYLLGGEVVSPLSGTGYRLPGEAEWEFACRAGTTTKYWVGDQDDDLMRGSWFYVNGEARTHSTGELQGNPFGLYDIQGNVMELVQDGWNKSWYDQFEEKPSIDPHSPFSVGYQRVARGSHWFMSASDCRSTLRHAIEVPRRHSFIGFRVALPIDAVRAAMKLTGGLKTL
jgi:formylglycine-generating enzyme required for sulfatase activity